MVDVELASRCSLRYTARREGADQGMGSCTHLGFQHKVTGLRRRARSGDL